MTLVVIIMTFNFNNGANVSRGHHFTVGGSIQFFKCCNKTIQAKHSLKNLYIQYLFGNNEEIL